MDFILDHKWIFFVLAEVIFWISILTFFTLRYWFKLNKLSLVFIALSLLNDLWIAALGFMDYTRTGEISSYQVVILIAIVYAFTYGKSDFRKLDAFIQKKVAKYKGESIPEFEQPRELYGYAYAIKEWKQFLGHLLIYAVAHVAMLLMFGSSQQMADIDSLNTLFTMWFAENQALFPFDHPDANNISRIWSIVLAIDAVITLSYTIFPKAEKKKIAA